MTSSDQLHIVNRCLHTPHEAFILAQAGLVVDLVKTQRLLVLVRCRGECALFVYISQSFPIKSHDEIVLEKTLPINSGFKFDIDSSIRSGPDAVYISVSLNKQKLLFEMTPGYHTQNFVSEMYRVTDSVTTNAQTAATNFSWLDKYKTAGYDKCDSGNGSLSSQQMATVLVNPIVGLDRESLVNYQINRKEDQFTDLSTFKFFVGTWNVNGQNPDDMSLQTWLAVDAEPPDFYVIGFQELDLSKEAFVFPESVKEEIWMRAVSDGLHPAAKYCLVKHIRLVAMLLIVYAKPELMDDVTNISVDTVGTGIMGKLGNKGGVTTRLRFHASDICFVNSHLAAHVEELERRNQDYSDICARTNFVTFEREDMSSLPSRVLKIKDHESVIWLGDLNYRINGLDTQQVKHHLINNNLNELKKCDQFHQQRNQRKIFVGFQEGEISFQPTYKYDPGTNTWDSSEKARPPAWTDRILWRGDNIKQTSYRSHMDLVVSDHKPVSAVFDIDIKVIDKSKRQKVREEVLKKFDMLENDFLPQVMVDTTELIYDTVKFMENKWQSLSIANTGQVQAQFEFIQKPGETSYCKPWLTVEPFSGCIMPGEKCEVRITMNVDKRTGHALNSGKDQLYDILVLHLLGGKDIFITVSGQYIKSSFGCSIDSLVKLKVPVGRLSPGHILSLENGELSKIPEEYLVSGSSGSTGYQIPKEIWLLCDRIKNEGLDKENLFLTPGKKKEMVLIRDWLDSGLPVESPQVSVHSLAESLLIFIESLREPVIPYSMLGRCLEWSSNYLQCKQIVSQLPANHKYLFDYLIGFLREVLKSSFCNALEPKIVAALFSSIILREPPEQVCRAKLIYEVQKKKTNFIYMFITQPNTE